MEVVDLVSDQSNQVFYGIEIILSELIYFFDLKITLKLQMPFPNVWSMEFQLSGNPLHTTQVSLS
jgi:hypothetical protein